MGLFLVYGIYCIIVYKDSRQGTIIKRVWIVEGILQRPK